jgi:hypothetical protein
MKLDLTQIDNPVVRDNFRKLDDEFQTSDILNGGFKLFDVTFEASGNKTIYHKLGFTPLDIIITHNSAGATYSHSNFNVETVRLTATGPGRVRFLLGRMK